VTKWAPTYRLRHLMELRDRLNPVRGMVTERPYELGIYPTKGRRRPHSKVAVGMDVPKDCRGSGVEKTWASGERSALKDACYVRRGGVGTPESSGPSLLPNPEKENNDVSTQGRGNPRKWARACQMIAARREGIRKFTNAEACEMQTTEAYLGLLRERGKTITFSNGVTPMMLESHVQ
jgi:hypothetical protein